MLSSNYYIQHSTVYKYSSNLRYGINLLRLYPQTSATQKINNWNITAPGNLLASMDGFFNNCHHFTLCYPTDSININASGVVTSYDCHVFKANERELSCNFYLQNFPQTSYNQEIYNFAHKVTKHCLSRKAKAIALMQAIYEKIEYSPKSTVSTTTAIESFKQGSGVCQDQAHIMLSCCRSIHIPARYVSGYLFSDNIDLASHAWVDIAINDNEWLSLDITHNQPTNNYYIRLANGPDYQSIPPIKGFQLGGVDEEMHVDILIQEQL